MIQAQVHSCGADVSKTVIDCRIENLRFQVPNTAEGHARLLAQLAPWRGRVQVICEGTGGLEAPLRDALQRARVPVSVMNPRWVRDFARSQGLLEKTDSIDAGVLALYGGRMRPDPSAPVPAAQRTLAALQAQREHFVQCRAIEKTRLHQSTERWLRQQIERALGFFTREIEKIEARIQALIAADPVLEKRVERVDEAAGFTRVGAARLLAVLPELGSLSRRQIGKLAGLAPLNHDSGELRGQRHIAGGRAAVRRALYMAALTAITHNRILKTFHQRLVQKGKPGKVALTAVMRKLLTLLNAALKNPQISLAN
jgi:transposase